MYHNKQDDKTTYTDKIRYNQFTLAQYWCISCR